jgi:hypothetical protein
LPDVLVNFFRAGDDGPGVVKEVLEVCVVQSIVKYVFVNCVVSRGELITLNI